MFVVNLEAGAVFGNVSNSSISDPSLAIGFWMAAGGGLALAWQPFDFFSVELTADLLGQLVPREFAVRVGAKIGLGPDALWKYQRVLIDSICNYQWWKDH